MGEDGVFEVDKDAITERVLSDLGPCVRCPILDLDSTAEITARLPERIDPNRDEAWRYRGSGPLSSWTVAKNNDPAPEEAPVLDPREGLFERLAKSVRQGGVGVVAASGAAPGSLNVPETRYEDVGGMRETVALVREAVELPITHPEIFQRLGIRPHKGSLTARLGPGRPCSRERSRTREGRTSSRWAGRRFSTSMGPERGAVEEHLREARPRRLR